MSSNKWDLETTIKFIQLYKLHQCLWNFQSPEYKIKQKRDAAYMSIVQEMNIAGFGTVEVKNKIKNLRSTYQQENKKIQDSKKSGAGLSNVYTSNIKWLKEMEEVFSKDLKKKVYENILPANEDTGPQDSCIATSSNNNQEVPANTSNNQQVPVTVTTTTTTTTPTNTGNTARGRKRAREIFQAVSDLKKLNEDVNSENETVFHVFGRSVALQLQNLSAENALLAQNRIQNILTEYGIQELRQRTAFHSSSSNYSYQRRSSAYSDTTNSSVQRTALHSSSSNYSYQRPASAYSDTANSSVHNDLNQLDETYVESPDTPISMSSNDNAYPESPSQSILATSSPVHNVNATPTSVSTNDIVAAAMYAAFETVERQQD